LEFPTLIASISVEFAETREQPKQRGHYQRAAVPVLNIGGMDHRVYHQSRRIDENVPFLAFDLLPRV
jgi:hypothetical protein